MGLLIQLVQAIATVLSLLIIARAVLSWVNPSPFNPLVRWVYRLTEPMLTPIQMLLPAPGGIDFSPLIVLVLIQVLERLIVNLLYNLAS
jgi:YggT family protein